MSEQLSVKWLCLFHWLMLWGWTLHPTGDRFRPLVGETRRSALRATWEPGRLPESRRPEAGVPAGPTLGRWPDAERRPGPPAKACEGLPAATAECSLGRVSSGGAPINSHRSLSKATSMTEGHRMTLEAESSRVWGDVGETFHSERRWFLQARAAGSMCVNRLYVTWPCLLLNCVVSYQKDC